MPQKVESNTGVAMDVTADVILGLILVDFDQHTFPHLPPKKQAIFLTTTTLRGRKDCLPESSF